MGTCVSTAKRLVNTLSLVLSRPFVPRCGVARCKYMKLDTLSTRPLPKARAASAQKSVSECYTTLGKSLDFECAGLTPPGSRLAISDGSGRDALYIRAWRIFGRCTFPTTSPASPALSFLFDAAAHLRLHSFFQPTLFHIAK